MNNLSVSPNRNISRRLTPTAVYKLQSLASSLLPRFKAQKKGKTAIAEHLAARFRLPQANVARLVGVKA